MYSAEPDIAFLLKHDCTLNIYILPNAIVSVHILAMSSTMKVELSFFPYKYYLDVSE